MESSGEGNAVHVSKETAQLLIDAGKGDWVEERKDSVHLKGKGELRTYWLVTKKNEIPASLHDEYLSQITLDTKTRRLIDWNVDILVRLVRKIVAHRTAGSRGKRNEMNRRVSSVHVVKPSGTNPLDEVVEIIPLPEFHNDLSLPDPHSVFVDPAIMKEIKEFVTTVATLYRDNPFHNFEHASHVCMSVAKLMNRIVAPSDMDFADSKQAHSKLHDHTYGITSCPLSKCVIPQLRNIVHHSSFLFCSLTIPLLDL
jgi:hypothetical protein